LGLHLEYLLSARWTIIVSHLNWPGMIAGFLIQRLHLDPDGTAFPRLEVSPVEARFEAATAGFDRSYVDSLLAAIDEGKVVDQRWATANRANAGIWLSKLQCGQAWTARQDGRDRSQSE
jgi:hypothetical protein